MTAVAAEPKGRTKLEQAEKALAELIVEREETHHEIVALGEEEQATVISEARRAPTQRLFGINSPILRLRTRRDKALRKLENLDVEIAAKREVVGEMRAVWAQEEADKFRREAERLRGVEVDRYVKAGQAFAALVDTYHDVLDAVEAVDRLYDETGPVRDHMAPDERERFARDLLPAVRPAPASFLRLVEVLTEACLDHRGQGLGEHGTAPVEAKLLHAAGVPFLKGQDRRLEASGRIPRSGTSPRMPARSL